ncbi:MAG: hypothetical protein GEU91_00860 [Rhizobiales bacterium]|nr:hypothetical protein [Hyphomicrobiales bacterium]
MSLAINFAKALAGLLLLATPAAAVDGEILIDQAKVTAGGITPGDDPGFPAVLSRPGRYKLTSNLNVQAGTNGIDVRQSDVTIDLNGFTISTSPSTQAASGVSLGSGAGNGLQISNGTITGFSLRAIHAFGERNVIENMRLVSNGSGVLTGHGSRVRNSTIASTGGFGIFCGTNCLIEQNVISGNGTGVLFDPSPFGSGLVLGNAIVSNRLRGLESSGQRIGYGNNILFGNNAGGSQVSGLVDPLHPNVCQGACP